MKILIVGADAQELRTEFRLIGHDVEHIPSLKDTGSVTKPDCILINANIADFPSHRIVGLRGSFGKHTPVIALRPEYSEDLKGPEDPTKENEIFHDDKKGQALSRKDKINIHDVEKGASYSLPSETHGILLSAYMKVAVQTSKRIAPKLEIGLGITLDRKSKTLSLGEKSAQLTLREYELLELLFEKDGQVIMLEDFLDRTGETEVASDYMSNNISRLRKKIVDVLKGNYPDKIATEFAKRLIRYTANAKNGYRLYPSLSVEVSVTTNPLNKRNFTP